MNLVQTTLLGALQGLTEFLPVSSSGHLVLGQALFNLVTPPIFFDVLVHLATLAAVLIFFREKISQLSRQTLSAILAVNIKQIPEDLAYLAVGSIPTALAGSLLINRIDSLFTLSPLLTLGFLITTATLASSYFAQNKNLNLDWKKAIIIGSFQGLAILPGISRSGLTIVAALWLGLNHKKAFEFSFLLSVPAILGAIAVQLTGVGTAGLVNLDYWLGFLVAFIFGYFSLKFLERTISTQHLYLFSFYTLSITAISLLLLWL